MSFILLYAEMSEDSSYRLIIFSIKKQFFSVNFTTNLPWGRIEKRFFRPHTSKKLNAKKLFI